jgi:hypothetical protein
MRVNESTALVHKWSQSRNDERTDGNVRHEGAVHDVDVDYPRASIHDSSDLGCQPAKVGRENRRCHQSLPEGFVHENPPPSLSDLSDDQACIGDADSFRPGR